MIHFIDEYSTILQFSDLRLTTIWDAKPESEEEPILTNVHSHPFYEMLISIGGVTLTLFGGETMILPPGSLCLIPPNIYHRTQELSRGKSKRALRFIYEQLELSDDGEPLYDFFHAQLSACQVPLLFTDAQAQAVYSLLTECSAELANGVPYAKTNTQLRLGTVFIGLLRLLTEQNAHSDLPFNTVPEDSRRMKIEIWIQQKYRENVTAKNLALHLNVSERQLTRILEQIYHCGFRELLIDIRMHTAAELLAMTDLSVEEIAFQVGYTSLSGFYSTFRRVFGVSAIQYRKNSHKMHINSDNKTPTVRT